MRSAWLLLLLFAACSESNDEAPAKPDENKTESAPKEVVSAPTGPPRLHEQIDGLEKDIEEANKRLDEVEAGTLDKKRAPTKAQVAVLEQRRRHYLSSAQLSVRGEARDHNNAIIVRLQQRLGETRQEQSIRSVEIDELQTIINDVLRGTAEVPEGRTLAGLKDRAADLVLERENLFKREDELKKELRVYEERRMKGEFPSVEDSLAVRAVDRAKELQQKIEALRKRLDID